MTGDQSLSYGNQSGMTGDQVSGDGNQSRGYGGFV